MASLPLADLGMIALPASAVTSLARSGPPAARVGAARNAGHSGGETLAAAFERWLQEQYGTVAAELSLEDFNARVGEFFAAAGWGSLTVSSLHDVAAAVEIESCWEAREQRRSAAPSCHMTTGALAAFFGHFAPEPLAAMEVECGAVGGSRCRFVLGSADTLDAVFQRISAGEDYDAALAQLSAESASP